MFKILHKKREEKKTTEGCINLENMYVLMYAKS
jgi:hypothetical protein